MFCFDGRIGSEVNRVEKGEEGKSVDNGRDGEDGDAEWNGKRRIYEVGGSGAERRNGWSMGCHAWSDHVIASHGSNRQAMLNHVTRLTFHT